MYLTTGIQLRSAFRRCSVTVVLDSGGSRPAVWGNPCSFPSFAPPFPSFPFPLPFPLPSPSFSPSLPLPFLQIQLKGLGERCKLANGRKCIFSIFLRHPNVSGGNSFAPFCADKMSMKTEKRTYLTVILPNCYSSEEVQHQTLKTRFLFIVKPFIYRMAPIFINSLSAI